MDNFIFSINTTMPIFLVMVIGYFLRRIKILNEDFVKVANKLNFKVTLPVLLFRDLSSVDIRAVFDLKYVLFCAIATSLCFWVIWGIAKLFMKDKTMIGAFVQASFRSSAAVMGLAFIQNVYGSSAMGPLMIVGAVPLYNVYSVLGLTFEGTNEDGSKDTKKLKEAAFNIIKNPIIIGVILGLAASYFRVDFPEIIDGTVNSVAVTATPLALIALGAGFEGRKALKKIKPTLVASFIKLFAQAAIFIPIATALGFTGEKMIAIVVMLAAPATPSCYIMAKNMNNDGTLTASIVVATTLLASLTLTMWIFILKTVNLI